MVAVVLGVTLPAAAAGATTIGQTTAGGVVGFNDAVALEPSYDVSAVGRIISFSFATSHDNARQQVDFLVLRPTATPDEYTVVGKTGVVTLAGAGRVESFAPAAPITVLPGDVLGMYAQGTVNHAAALGTKQNTSLSSNGPDPALYATVTAPGSLNSDLNESAEFTTGAVIDSHLGGIVTASDVLTAGQPYTVTVRGTYSPWTATLMSTPWWPYVICGTPEPAPIFPSPGVANGPVGMDAVSTFAQPFKRGCRRVTLPKTQHKFLMNLDGGGTFTALTPTTSDPVTHTYTYSVVGQGAPLRVALDDSNYKDNYGELEVSVAPAS